MKHDGMEWIRLVAENLKANWQTPKHSSLADTTSRKNLTLLSVSPSNSNMWCKFGHGPRPLSQLVQAN